MKIPTFPTNKELKEIEKKIQGLLDSKLLRRKSYFYAKEGYKFCLQLVQGRIKDPTNPFYLPDTEQELSDREKIIRDQMEPIKALKTVKGRTIAVLCIDYLNGQSNPELFLDVLNIKKPKIPTR